MDTVDASVLSWLLPVLLTAAWLVLRVRRRRVTWRFFAVAVGAGLLCLVGGVAVAATAPSGQEVSGEGLGSAAGILLLVNGVAGLAWALVLGVLTGVVLLVRRRAS